MRTFIVAPLTTGGHPYPPDQLRTVDRERLVKHLGVLTEATLLQVLAVLQEMFAPC